MTKFYIGTKQIEAQPMSLGDYNDHRGWTIPADEDPARPGYLVVYPDGYQSWSPKETFEAAYLPMGEDNDGSRVTEQMVDDFIVGTETTRMGNHTVVHVTLRNGFSLIESSACVDAKNYDEAIGYRLAMEKAKGRVWHLLGFLLASARNGVGSQA